MLEIFSEKRLYSYSSFDEYLLNIKTSQFFYPKLHFIEICLRNKIDLLLLKNLGSDWIKNNKHILPIDQQSKINPEYNHDKLVADLTFGAWINILVKHYNLFSDKDLVYLFRLSKKQVNRQYSQLCHELKMIKNFRNRVFHYEKVDNHRHYKNIGTLIDKFLKLLDIEDILVGCVQNVQKMNGYIGYKTQ